ncbi:hypothetical protein [uncultured Cellulomonas sp.]|uniref:hypothetical protein n=1 Tax=uncultured Cellulomonas sp. TaxID=189682 RepID=UPI0028E53E69|nr:hypothetical protein [uncultured Cellulomonas sp.]
MSAIAQSMSTTEALGVDSVFAKSVVDNAFSRLGGDSLLSALRSIEDEIYLVGGAVRDALAGTDAPRDLDLMIPNFSTEPHRILRGLADGRQNRHGNWRYVLCDGLQIDVIEPRFFYRNFTSAAGALAYFDASVNAIGFRIGDGCVLDPLGGARDLAKRRVTLPVARWSSMNDFESVHVTLRVARLLSRLALKVVNPSLALDQYSKFDLVDWTELERLNGVSRGRALEQVRLAFG